MAAETSKPLQPLFLDIYEGDYAEPDIDEVVADQRYYGMIIKATEGLYYAPQWGIDNWPKIKQAGGDRYGSTWFRGSYCFLKFNQDGKLQADFYLQYMERAGGWDAGDLWPIVDVELGNDGKSGGKRNSNQDASRQQIEDCVTAWADWVKSQTGRQIMLYGGGAMFERGITSHMNCDWLWFPRYTPTLPANTYTRIGWSLDRLWGWQYSGDSTSYLKDYPVSCPLGKKGDITVMVLDGGIEKLCSLLWAENPVQ